MKAEKTGKPNIGGALRGSFHVIFRNLSTVLIIIAAFLIGVLSTEVRYLKKGVGGTATTAGTTGAAAPTQPTGQQAEKQITADQIKKLFSGNTIRFGDANRKVVFVEFSDPSCPYCHIAGGENLDLNQSAGGQFQVKSQGGSYVPPVPEMRKLVDQGKASFVWIYSPGHGNGEMGTMALYCAQEKGKFWAVHDLLMNKVGYDMLNTTVKNDTSKSKELADFLKSAMNPTDMKNCLDSGKYKDQLTTDTTLGKTEFGVQGTPGFFVNTQRFNGAYSYTDMESAVKAAL